jgi:hypothetical protein
LYWVWKFDERGLLLKELKWQSQLKGQSLVEEVEEVEEVEVAEPVEGVEEVEGVEGDPSLRL